MPVALITGAARGIGRAIATEFARDHDVAITWYRTAPDGLLSEAPGIHATRANLTEPGAAAGVVDEVIARFGTIDVIVNNAGTTAASPLEAFNPDDWSATHALNVAAPAALLASALPHLKPGSAIVNISSINADLPPRGAVAYGASKAALNLWTRGMAKELGPRGIRVNAVAPGAVNTPEAPRAADLTQAFLADTALGALAEPVDIAQAVRFLASPAARAITGQILGVSGGYRL